MANEDNYCVCREKMLSGCIRRGIEHICGECPFSDCVADPKEINAFESIAAKKVRRERIMALYNLDMSFAKISELTGYTQATVSAVVRAELKKQGIELPKKDRRRDLTELAAEGLTIKQAANRLGVTYSAVQQLARYYSIDFKKRKSRPATDIAKAAKENITAAL